MATTKTDIGTWFDEGKDRKATHLIVVCDTLDHEDYPVYADGNDDCLQKYTDYNGPNMQRVMEVYDLRKSKDVQLSQIRVMNLPRG